MARIVAIILAQDSRHPSLFEFSKMTCGLIKGLPGNNSPQRAASDPFKVILCLLADGAEAFSSSIELVAGTVVSQCKTSRAAAIVHRTNSETVTEAVAANVAGSYQRRSRISILRVLCWWASAVAFSTTLWPHLNDSCGAGDKFVAAEEFWADSSFPWVLVTAGSSPNELSCGVEVGGGGSDVG